MTLQEIIADIHAQKEDVETYERKYGVLSAMLTAFLTTCAAKNAAALREATPGK